MVEKVIPVIVIEDINDTEKIIGSLNRGGINIAEITFRTECAPRAIEIACDKFPNMQIGAGTIINKEQCEKAIKCGAKFIVSPGCSEEVALFCKKENIPYFPGCVTPTEIMKAISLGINIVKFFPANIYGGLNALKALSAPFPQIKFIPTGGIDEKNLLEYLKFSKVYAIGGSFMMKGDIEENSKKIKELIDTL